MSSSRGNTGITETVSPSRSTPPSRPTRGLTTPSTQSTPASRWAEQQTTAIIPSSRRSRTSYTSPTTSTRPSSGERNTVLGGPNGTQGLGPYHTPWVWVGGSYPGTRGAWIRLRNPEVFYAVWSSSAPLQMMEDGAIYFNPIYRGIPKNCSADIHAAAKFVDSALEGSDKAAEQYVKAAVAIATGAATSTGMAVEAGNGLTADDIANQIFWTFSADVQDKGIGGSIQKFCDYMEAFNVDQYKSNPAISSDDVGARAGAFLSNDGTGRPRDEGIAASSSEVGFAALLYGFVKFQPNTTGDDGTVQPPVDRADFDIVLDHSWSWQVATEMGMYQTFNASSALAIGSSGRSLATTKQNAANSFGSIPAEDIPAAPNTTYPLSFGGWSMSPSNVMFTSGEFDPWRAFGVMSQEQDLGAPVRKVVQNIPKCGESPSGTDVFGLLYEGQVHVSDFLVDTATEVPDKTKNPLYRGTDLFIRAYNAWLPCFNASRTQVNPNNYSSNNNNGGGDGKKKDNSAPGRLGAWTRWEVVALVVSFILYQI